MDEELSYKCVVRKNCILSRARIIKCIACLDSIVSHHKYDLGAEKASDTFPSSTQERKRARVRSVLTKNSHAKFSTAATTRTQNLHPRRLFSSGPWRRRRRATSIHEQINENQKSKINEATRCSSQSCLSSHSVWSRAHLSQVPLRLPLISSDDLRGAAFASFPLLHPSIDSSEGLPFQVENES